MPNPIFRVNSTGPEYKASLRSRLIVAVILIAFIVPCLIIGSWAFFVAIALFLGIAVLEMIKAPGKPYGWWVYLTAYATTFCFVYWFVFKGNGAAYLQSLQNGTEWVFSLESYFSGLDISIVGVATAIFTYFLIATLDKDFTFNDVAYFVTFSILIGIGFQSIFFLRYYPFYIGSSPAFVNTEWYGGLTYANYINEPGFKFGVSSELIFFALLGGVLNDTFAYFGGIYFGKHPLNKRISPHKTVEGFLFGVILSAIALLTIGLSLAAAGYPILPTLDLNHWYYILILSIVIPLLAVVGDLSFSLVKRHFDIKDFGNILRGHGGVLDRLDSLLFVAAGTTVLCIFITNGFNFFL